MYINTNLLFVCLMVCSAIAAEQTSRSQSAEERSLGSGLARSMLADIAKELIARSGTNSQVLSLNLSNLILLLVVKGLLVGIAMLGSGTYKARNSEDDTVEFIPRLQPIVTESELLLLITYLMGETNSKYDCLKKVACYEPKKTREYVAAGKMLIKGAKILKKIIPFNSKYETLVAELQEATQYGSGGGVCDEKYSCSSRQNLI